MVNSKDFTIRLKKIMDYNEITAAVLADKIQVQRSSISHILSGRNKPSLEFVMKVIKSFPEVDLYWLLNGSGAYPLKAQESPPTRSDAEKTSQLSDNSADVQEKLGSILNSDQIERIVVFYKNGKFKSYTP